MKPDGKSMQDLVDESFREAAESTDIDAPPRRKMDQDRLLARLQQCWHALPHLRLGQLIENARLAHSEYANAPDSFYIEDEELERAINGLYDEHVRGFRTEGV